IAPIGTAQPAAAASGGDSGPVAVSFVFASGAFFPPERLRRRPPRLPRRRFFGRGASPAASWPSPVNGASPPFMTGPEEFSSVLRLVPSGAVPGAAVAAPFAPVRRLRLRDRRFRFGGTASPLPSR